MCPRFCRIRGLGFRRLAGGVGGFSGSGSLVDEEIANPKP